MRLLHTSDWHLGRTFYGVDLYDAHASFISHLLHLNEQEQYTAVLISGDIYDRGIPPTRSLELFELAVDGLLQQGTRVIVTSGNHDSFQRLGANRRQLERAGLHIRTHLSDITDPVELTDGAETVLIYGIPYLEPALVYRTLGSRRSHQAVLSHAVDAIRTHSNTYFPSHTRIVMAHAFVTGSTPSESERELDIGGVGNAGAGIFDGFDYVALGHLHSPQNVGDLCYSGSPLAFSFPEVQHSKTLVDIRIENNAVSHQRITLPRFVNAHTIRGNLCELVKHPLAGSEALIEAIVTDPPAAQILPTLRASFPGLIKLEYTTLKADYSTVPEHSVPSAVSDSELFDNFIQYVTGAPATRLQAELFAEALTHVVSEDA